VHCGNSARLAFVGQEEFSKKNNKYICNLCKNKENDKLWPHDLCSVAVYLCEKCLEPTAIFNQA